MAMYHVVQRSTSKAESKILAAKMGFILEVIHLSGQIIIQQGIDGLNWGLYLDPKHTSPMKEVLEAPPYDGRLHAFIVNTLLQYKYTMHKLEHWKVTHQLGDWDQDMLYKTATYWVVVPRLEACVVNVILQAWIKEPTVMEA
eukprot:11687112-Ditylum_brightwellii.AAC.2